MASRSPAHRLARSQVPSLPFLDSPPQPATTINSPHHKSPRHRNSGGSHSPRHGGHGQHRPTQTWNESMVVEKWKLITDESEIDKVFRGEEGRSSSRSPRSPTNHRSGGSGGSGGGSGGGGGGGGHTRSATATTAVGRSSVRRSGNHRSSSSSSSAQKDAMRAERILAQYRISSKKPIAQPSTLSLHNKQRRVNNKAHSLLRGIRSNLKRDLLMEHHGSAKSYTLHQPSKEELRRAELDHQRKVLAALAHSMSNRRVELQRQFASMSKEAVFKRLCELLSPLVQPWRSRRLAERARQEAAAAAAEAKKRAEEVQARIAEREKQKELERLQHEEEEMMARRNASRRSSRLSRRNSARREERDAIAKERMLARQAELESIMEKERERIKQHSEKFMAMAEEKEQKRMMEEAIKREQEDLARMREQERADARAAAKEAKSRQMAMSHFERLQAAKRRLPLIKAIENLQVSEVKRILNSFDDEQERIDLVNSQDDRGNTPLVSAILHKNLSICEILVANGADTNLTNNRERAPLHHACAIVHRVLIKFLIQNGADHNIRDTSGKACWELVGKLHGSMKQQDIDIYVHRCARGFNHPPVLNRSLPALKAYYGMVLQYVIPEDTFIDPDGDEITYHMSGLPPSFHFDVDTRTLRGIPTKLDVAQTPWTLVVETQDEFTTASTTLVLHMAMKP